MSLQKLLGIHGNFIFKASWSLANALKTPKRQSHIVIHALEERDAEESWFVAQYQERLMRFVVHQGKRPPEQGIVIPQVKPKNDIPIAQIPS